MFYLEFVIYRLFDFVRSEICQRRKYKTPYNIRSSSAFLSLKLAQMWID
jgi:hypothetical protein